MEAFRVQAVEGWRKSPTKEYLRLNRLLRMTQARMAELLGRIDTGCSY